MYPSLANLLDGEAVLDVLLDLVLDLVFEEVLVEVVHHDQLPVLVLGF